MKQISISETPDNTCQISPILLRTVENVNKFISKNFSSVVVEGPKLNPEKLESLSVMPICTHRSQADYFIFGFTLHRLGFRRIRFAAGDNLTELPYIGPRFIKLGAFPVSRSQAMNRTYLRNLCEQVTEIMLNGENPVVFPEGGRSYKGDMMDIKGGLLGSCLVAQWRNPEKDYHFFPASISYEKLPELPFFDMLEKGKNIRAEKKGLLNRMIGNTFYFGADILAFARLPAASAFGSRCGSVYIDYLEPVSIKDFIDLKALYSNKRNDFSSLRTATTMAEQQISRWFLSLYRILPVHIVSHILYSSNCSSRRETVSRTMEIINNLIKQNRNLKSLTSLCAEEIVNCGIKQLKAFNAVKTKNDTLTATNSKVIKYHAATITSAMEG